ncbi:14548_t:CDS:2 [Acaulospora colombiana]|uniref:14548_t:CDS:1 n=1 Tax=Acaulospora colombiana TaxID=27376 RepID=A0ACA9M4Y7_9GLOM|nr:14548_t:CDS:2 [Acaulospora colombiana]
MTLLTLAQKRYLQEYQTSEMFMTAHRSVKTGLVASAVVSSWTWAATLLQSSTVAYEYGVSGPFWYASGATIQVLLFAILAIELKRKAPNAHTFLEIVNARYGTDAHIVFLVFALATNRIKATFLTDYVHTTVIFVIILSFLFTVYCTSPEIGSPDKMYELLHKASQTLATNNTNLSDNAQSSYLTMDSLQGLIFGIINIVGNFGTVFVDNAYWQRAIAARPSSTVKAYLIGGLSWFAIPFTLATTMGLAGVALVGEGSLAPLSSDQVSSGLVLPLAAAHLLGKAGAFAVLVLVFMAVTSAASAELIAVSSIYTYDIYRTYIHSGALGSQVIVHSHYSVIGFGLGMGALAVILNYINITLGYMYLLMGIICSPAVFPVAFTLTWKKQTRSAAIGASVIGVCAGIVAWLVTAKKLYGVITIDSTGANYPMLAGNLTSLMLSLIITLVWSTIAPDNFDFEVTRTKLQILTDDEIVDNATYQDPIETDPVRLRKAFEFAVTCSIALTIILVLIWPLPMYFTHYVFSPKFFKFWVALSFIWALCSTTAVAIYPLYESRNSILSVFEGIVSDIKGEPIKPKTDANHSEDKADYTVENKA